MTSVGENKNKVSYGVCAECGLKTRLRPNGLCWKDAWSIAEKEHGLLMKISDQKDMEPIYAKLQSRLALAEEMVKTLEFLKRNSWVSWTDEVREIVSKALALWEQGKESN